MKQGIILFSLLGLLALSSCGEKCTTCTISYTFSGQTVENEQPEFCGSKDDVDTYKEALQNLADQTATAAGGASASFTCSD